MPLDQDDMPRSIVHWSALVFVICAVLIYIVGETVQVYLRHPWRHLVEASVVGFLMAILFYWWRSSEKEYIARVRYYATNKKSRSHNIRNQLQLLMVRCDNDTEAKNIIRKIDMLLNNGDPHEDRSEAGSVHKPEHTG